MIFVDVCDGIKRLHTKNHLSDCLSFGRSLCIMHSNQCFSEWFWDKWFSVKRRSVFLPTVIFSMPAGYIFHKVSKSVWIIQKHFVYHISTFPSVSIFLVIATMIIIWINIKRNFGYNHHLTYFMLLKRIHRKTHIFYSRILWFLLKSCLCTVFSHIII